MRNVLSAGVLLGLTAALAAPAAATPFHLQFLSNVMIAGTSYNVAFSDDAFLDLTAAQQVPTFTTEAQAGAALSAIMLAPGYAAMEDAANVLSSPFTSVVVPFSASFSRNAFVGDTVMAYRGLGSEGPAPVAGAGNLELNSNVDYNFAGITLATFEVVGVPEPASFAMLALGLFGLGWARRRM